MAHVVRRLWDMDGTPNSGKNSKTNNKNARNANVNAASTALAPYAMEEFQQPVWRPTGGGHRGLSTSGGVSGGGHEGGRFSPADHAFDENNPEPFLRGLTTPYSEPTSWGSAASEMTEDDIGRGYLGDGGGDGRGRELDDVEDWVGAGRSLAWAPGEGKSAGTDDPGRDNVARYLDGLNLGKVEEVDGGREGKIAGNARADDERRARRSPLAAAARRHAGTAHGRARQSVAVARTVEKEGTRPAGMWEVTPPPHVAAMKRVAKQGPGNGGGLEKGGPAYLRGVQSKIGPQVGAHKERLRKVRRAFCCCILVE